MSELVTPEIAGLRPYSPGKPSEELAREGGVPNAVKMASNENAIGPSAKAVEAAREALSELRRYPDATCHALKQALSSHLGVTAEQLVLGNGSNELLELLVRTFTTSQHHIVFATPSFVVYRSAALCHGVAFTPVPLRDGRHDLPAMLEAVRPNTRIVFIANPNNPTGTFVRWDELSEFLKGLRDEIIPILDEAYFEYADDPEYPDGLEYRELHPRLVVLRTFSKAYGLASLRVGYGVCPPELVDYMNRVRAPFNVNGVAQAAAVAALADQAHLRRVVELNASERDRVTRSLEQLGASVLPSQSNFLLVEFQSDAASVNDNLLARGVIARPVPGLPRALRVTLGTREENDLFLTAVKELSS